VRRIIFNIEDRASIFLYHWFIYMITGLRHLKTGGTQGNGGGGKLEQNKELFSGVVQEPYKVYFNYNPSYKDNLFFLDFQEETFELLKGKFELVRSINNDDIVLNNYGELINDYDEHHIPTEGYDYLKSIFEIPYENDEIKYKKKYFIRRSKSHLLDGNQYFNNIKRRQIINENNLCDVLSTFGIEPIFLEDLSIREKIKLFRNSETIISPNSAGLLFSIFSNKNKIVEINVSNPSQLSNQYQSICTHFNIPYFKYTSEKRDSNDNMEINIDDFITFLKNNFII